VLSLRSLTSAGRGIDALHGDESFLARGDSRANLSRKQHSRAVLSLLVAEPGQKATVFATAQNHELFAGLGSEKLGRYDGILSVGSAE